MTLTLLLTIQDVKSKAPSKLIPKLYFVIISSSEKIDGKQMNIKCCDEIIKFWYDESALDDIRNA